jgi:3',5'-nucleoside bisphosphate phosphatase
MIDLHSHTTASDGQHPPAELVRLAWQAGVRHLAVTDHDTVAGIAAARAAGGSLGVEIFSGIELSAFLDGREVHVLGHFIEPANAALAELSIKLRAERRARMVQMVAKLNALGVPVTLSEAEAFSGGENLGRPHLARALVERGWVGNVKEAFDRFLGNGKAAFVDREKLPAARAIALIHGAQGTATLAHPAVSRVERQGVEQLAQAGLDGLEVFHSDHNPSMRAKYLAMAGELRLVATAGSDFHGAAVAPNRKLGTADMSPESLAALRARCG